MKLTEMFDLASSRSIEKFGTDDVFVSMDPWGLWTRPSLDVDWVLVVKREEFSVRT